MVLEGGLHPFKYSKDVDAAVELTDFLAVCMHGFHGLCAGGCAGHRRKYSGPVWCEAHVGLACGAGCHPEMPRHVLDGEAREKVSFKYFVALRSRAWSNRLRHVLLIASTTGLWEGIV